MGYIGVDHESLSAGTHSMRISDPILSQVDTQFDLVKIYFENCSMVFDAKFIIRPSTSSGKVFKLSMLGQ